MKKEKLCDYGCSHEAKFIFKNGKKCCSKHYRSCPFMAKKIGKTRIGKTHTDESKEKIGKAQKGQPAWNKGLTKDTDERLKKVSQKLKGHTKIFTKESKKQWLEKQRNRIPWNKGKTAADDSRIASGERNGMFGKDHSDEVKEASRKRNKESGSFIGKNNPWYGKSRSKELSPRWNPNISHTEFQLYRNKVSILTEKTYNLYKQEINPNNYVRSKSGTLNGWQLDHIMSVKEGYLKKMTPEELSKKENLQMLSWQENLKKGG